jgi:hypothetical protein
MNESMTVVITTTLTFFMGRLLPVGPRSSDIFFIGDNSPDNWRKCLRDFE